MQECYTRACALVRFFNTQHVATRRNMVAKRAQHDEPNNIAMCCIEILPSFGRSLQISWANNVGICYIYMLRSFDRGLIFHPLMQLAKLKRIGAGNKLFIDSLVKRPLKR